LVGWLVTDFFGTGNSHECFLLLHLSGSILIQLISDQHLRGYEEVGYWSDSVVATHPLSMQYHRFAKEVPGQAIECVVFIAPSVDVETCYFFF
jgi:phage gp46-like protein